jgi:hypothetical protein
VPKQRLRRNNNYDAVSAVAVSLGMLMIKEILY